MGPDVMDIDLLTIRDVAGLLKLHRRTLERMIRAREFPPPRLINGRRRWSAEAVRKWLQKQPVEKQGHGDEGR